MVGVASLWPFLYYWGFLKFPQRFFINLSLKQGSLFVLFCQYLRDPQNQDASDLGRLGKLSRRRGAWAWLHDVWTCGAKVLE
jgi:hypothetical protein